jgi:hypothetical protein
MIKVGIFTPYVRNEVTLAATQFADWLVRCGIDVVMLSAGKIESGIHPIWDKRVKRSHKQAVYRWAYGCTHLCWFSADLEALRYARLVSFDNKRSKTKNFFFPYWSHWPTACDRFMFEADRIICLNRDIFNWLQMHRPANKIIDDGRTWANLVPSAQVLIPKHGRINKTDSYLMVLLPKTVQMDLGKDILNVFDFLLTEHPHLYLTLVSECSLPRNYRSKIAKLTKLYGDRLEFISSPPYYSYVNLARKHDWVYIANTRHLFGSTLSTLTGSSVPLICHDVPLVSAHVQDERNGRLIPCSLYEKLVPIADVKVGVINDYLHAMLKEPTIVLKAMQYTGVEQLKKRQLAFEHFVYKEFVS